MVLSTRETRRAESATGQPKIPVEMAGKAMLSAPRSWASSKRPQITRGEQVGAVLRPRVDRPHGVDHPAG